MNTWSVHSSEFYHSACNVDKWIPAAAEKVSFLTLTHYGLYNAVNTPLFRDIAENFNRNWSWWLIIKCWCRIWYHVSHATESTVTCRPDTNVNLLTLTFTLLISASRLLSYIAHKLNRHRNCLLAIFATFWKTYKRTGWHNKTSQTLSNYNSTYTLCREASFCTFVNQYVVVLICKFQWHH